MSIKTPQEIALEQFNKMHSLAAESCENEILGMIAEAIEADRAQRADDLATLADAAANWSTELADYVIPAASDAESAEYEAECDRITAALGRYLDDAEAPRV